MVLIAGAGGVAHLPGMIASKTIIPVLGVPVKSKNLNGLLAVEFFNQKMDGLLCSQFNQLVRCITGVPFGDISISNNWEMINLLSENFSDLTKYYSEKNKIHLYNKYGIKTKRKLNHINRLIN